jgi:methionine-rich copper-binding protein CopC
LLEDFRFMRNLARLALAVAAASVWLAAPPAVMGHVELISSSPQAGDNLDAAPTEVTLTFDDELDPDRSSFTVTDADGGTVGSGEVDLTVADRNVMTGAVSITDPGVYTVGYRVVGVDGHVLGGAFSFGFNALRQIPEPTEGEEGPDTAMPAPEPSIVQLAGGLLLGLAILIGVRRRMLR